MHSLFLPRFFCVLLVALSSAHLNAQHIDRNGMIGNTPVKEEKAMTATKVDLNTNNGYCGISRSMYEINQPIPVADAYPFISPDGLRLYFTQGGGAQVNDLFFASRTSTNAVFGVKQALGPNFSGGFSCWLTNNELSIYYLNNNFLNVASRSTSTSAFGTPSVVSITNFVGSFFAGPSLTPNLAELYVFTTPGMILKCVNTGALNYSIVDTLDLPPGYSSGPGQLSKDGLTYYFSLDSANTTTRLYSMNRASLTATFSNLMLLPPVINGNYRNFQASVASNQDIMVWTRNEFNTWAGNDLYITCSAGAVGIDEGIRYRTGVSLYPNPTNGTFQLSIRQYLQEGVIKVYGLLGQLVFEQAVYEGENTLQLPEGDKGCWHYVIYEGKVVLACGKLLIE